MEKNKNDINYLTEVAALIDEATVARIDFDELKSRLINLHGRLEAQETLAAEYALLRDDCERRIAGMAKAIAAVDRKRDRLEEALALVEELPGLTSVHLLQTYRRIAARFRDSFPGSFGFHDRWDKGARSSSASQVRN